MAGFDRVFLFGDPASPPVLLLHEFPGLSPQSLEFADELSAAFRVYVPLLFGDPNSSKEDFAAAAQYFLTQRWQFDDQAQISRPVLWQLRGLLTEISNRHPGQSLGAIGMCLTGSLPIALASDPAVTAIVISQPSLPLLNWGRASRRSALGVSGPELETATRRILAGELRVYGTRFEGDTTSKSEKWTTMQELWGEHFLDREICAEERDEHGIREGAHSVLTAEWRPGLGHEHPVEVRQREVAEFLAHPEFATGTQHSRCR